MQKLLQEFAGTGVEADEGVVEDEHTGACKECLGELELAELATGEENDVLGKHFGDAEELVKCFLQFGVLCRG